MKARVIRPKNIEKQKETIYDLMNDLVWHKSAKPSTFSESFSSTAGSKDWFSSPAKLGFALLTGSLLQQYSQSTTSSISQNPLSGYEKMHFISSAVTGVTSLPTSSCSTQDMGEVTKINTQNSKLSEEKYIHESNLSKKELGPMSERYNAIYKKISLHKRIIEREDLKAIHQITKAQNLGGVSLMMCSGSIFLSVFSKSLPKTTKMKAFQLGFFGFFTFIGWLSHYNWRFSKFLDHLNKKYFYSTSLKDLQSEQTVKTNVPKKMSFKSQISWSFRPKAFRRHAEQKMS